MKQQTTNSYFSAVPSHPDTTASSSACPDAHSVKRARRDDDTTSSSSTTVDGAPALSTTPITPTSNNANETPQVAMNDAIAEVVEEKWCSTCRKNLPIQEFSSKSGRELKTCSSCIIRKRSTQKPRNDRSNPANNPKRTSEQIRKSNGTEGHHMSNRNSKEKRESHRKGISIPDQPYADLLLEKAAKLQDFVGNHPGLSAALSNPSNIVSVDTAAKNRSREGVDLISFSSYSHKSKTWFFAYIKGSGWQVNRWRAGPNSFRNPAFTISMTEHTVNETKALYVEFVDGCTVLGFESNDELRINSWLRSSGVGSLKFLDMGRSISYSTHKALSIFGEHGIVKTPDSVLTNIVKRLFESDGHTSSFKPVLIDMTYEVAAKQPISDPTADAMRLFNLFYCLYEVLLRYHDEGDVDEVLMKYEEE